jgi:RNA ligase
MALNWDNVEEQVRGGYISKQRHPSAPLTIYNYTHKCQYDWKWTPEALTCRGLIVADSGEIVARPFPKFFSVEQLNGQTPAEPFEVYEKLDGSLGVLYIF